MFRPKIYAFRMLAIAHLLASCGNNAAPPQGPPAIVPVTVETARQMAATYFDEYPATVVALNQTEIRSQVTGYVTGIFFRDGARVKSGQKLYSIDAQVYAANYDQAQANLRVQETNLEKAQKDADRYHELDKRDAIAKQQVDYADATLEAAKKQVEAARASLNAVRANVAFTSISAPFSGTIGISQVRMGSAVVAGQTLLNTVSTDNPIAVDFNIDQKELYRFSQLQIAQRPGDSTFSIAFGSEIYPHSGRIELIDRAVDPQTASIRLRLVFANDNSLLKPGMTTTVRVRNNAGQQMLAIPYKAVTEQLGEFFVYVVGDSNKVTQRKILLGKAIGTNVLVKEGLKEGEKFVVQGVQNLREGVKITTAQPGQPGPARK